MLSTGNGGGGNDGMSQCYFPLNHAVRTGDSFPHGRYAISIALCLFRPVEVCQGEGQCQTFFFFPRMKQRHRPGFASSTCQKGRRRKREDSEHSLVHF